MKLRIPKCLMILALAALPHAWAATVIGTGVSYDNGKGSYSQNPEAHPDIAPKAEGKEGGDGLYCWANSAANMIQYWQDTYGDKLVDGAPNGFNSTVYGSPDGTRYLNVYETFLSAGKINDTGYQSEAINWYFKQEAKEWLNSNSKQYLINKSDAPTTVSDHAYSYDYFWDIPVAGSLARMKGELSDAFATKGQVVGLSIVQQDPADDAIYEKWRKGGYDPADEAKLNTRNHAVTCWGYEIDDSGTVSALYLTDSDDLEFGVFKVHVAAGETLPGMSGYSHDAIILRTDDTNDGYGGFVVSLSAVEYMETPQTDSQGQAYAKSAVDAGGSRVVPTLQGGSATSPAELMTNTTVSGAVTRSGAGVKVGGTNTAGVPQIVMLVSEDATSSLTLEGTGTTGSGTGLEVEKGSLASLANLSVSGYERGVDAEGKVYLYGGEVKVEGNVSDGDGAGIYNANYVEIYGAETVNILDNTATTGKGGGIYNAKGEVLSIRNNGEVNFSGNTAASGNDIYNDGGKVNIADNGVVSFTGTGADSAAVVNTNGGDLYLKSAGDGRIEINNAALDSTGGTVHVGSDINGSTSATTLTMKETATFLGEEYENATMTISGGSGDAAATLKNLKVTASAIVGAGTAAGFISHADVYVDNFYQVASLANLRVDSSTTVRANAEAGISVILNNVVVDLTGLTPLYQDNAYTFDLTGMFSGFNQILFDTLYLDAGSCTFGETGLGDTDSVVVKFASGVFPQDAEAETITLALLAPGGMVSSQSVWGGQNVTFGNWVEAPEPTTGMLSLLALAGLCARRRRKA